MSKDVSLVNKKKRIIEIFWGVEACLLIAFLISLINFGIVFSQIILIFMGLYLLPYILVKKNKISLSANYLIINSTLLILTLVWQHGGLLDEVMLVFPLVVAFSVLFGSKNLLKYVFTIVIANIILIGALNEYGIINNSPPKGGVISAVFIVLIFTLITVTLSKFGTDLTNALTKLNQNKDQLEDNVAERTKELEAKIEELKDAHKQLSEAERMASLGRLVAGISHEINTPVGIAVTAASHLQIKANALDKAMKRSGLKKSELEKFIETSIQSSSLIDSNLRRAADLIGDFKNLAVLNTACRRSQFLLKPAINEVLASLKPTIQQAKANIIFECDDNLEVLIDQGALAQILVNLVSNSCIHGFSETENGTIKVDVTSHKADLIISYSDNGKGLTTEVAEKIFEPFYTTKRNQGGTGLGMNIVYNLVRQTLLGTIEIDHDSTNGVLFQIRFPKRTSTE